MPTNLETAVELYLRARRLSDGTRGSYFTTLKKWSDWGGDVAIEDLRRHDIRDFLDWVCKRAVEKEGMNPGRTANKAREHPRALMSWAWEQDLVETLPRFPKPRRQRDAAGRHYLPEAEINALYFATHDMKRPRGRDQSIPVVRVELAPRSWRNGIDLWSGRSMPAYENFSFQRRTEIGVAGASKPGSK